MLINYGEFKLRETDESEMFYIATLDTCIIVTKDKYDLHPYDIVGKVKVYHDGLYFGTVEEMNNWISNEIIRFLKENGKLVEDGETIMGDKCWKLQA